MSSFILDEVIALLEAYLDDEIIIIHETVTSAPSKRKRKSSLWKIVPSRISISKLSETDALLASIDLLGRRVMNKYIRGEKPHPERLELLGYAWHIVNNLIALGMLEAGVKMSHYHTGYSFHCLRWQSDVLGEILLPYGPLSVDANFVGEKRLVPMKNIDGLNKKSARMRIITYCREQGILNHKGRRDAPQITALSM